MSEQQAQQPAVAEQKPACDEKTCPGGVCPPEKTEACTEGACPGGACKKPEDGAQAPAEDAACEKPAN